MEFPNETNEEKLERLRTLAINENLIEKQFRKDVSHCHFCRGDISGPCAWPFKEWMSCINAHGGDSGGGADLENPKCYKFIEGLV